MTLAKLEEFVGLSGHTSDEEFAKLVESLDAFALVAEEEEEAGTRADFVFTRYQVPVTGETYELWYQVRTPKTPEGFEFAFGFDRA
jgi:hypothetical protein